MRINHLVFENQRTAELICIKYTPKYIFYAFFNIKRTITNPELALLKFPPLFRLRWLVGLFVNLICA